MAKRKRRKKGRKPRGAGWKRRVFGVLVLAVPVVGGGWLWRLDHTLRERFDGRRWALASRIYARPLELYPGAPVGRARLLAALQGLGYREALDVERPGTYRAGRRAITVHLRGFPFPDGPEPERVVRVSVGARRVTGLTGEGGAAPPEIVRLDPALMASIYPDDREDRVLVRSSDVPPLLVKALVAVEDRSFFVHPGIDFRAIGRALWADLRAGRVVQGGSTLTQQLVKNFYLSAERTWRRKGLEAVMAVLLELHYGKEEILETYLNEIYLGQQASRAVHGVGLASRFYFGRPVQDLDVEQIALLVGMVRGPSYYDPRTHPVRARQRRDRVLGVLATQGLIDDAKAQRARAAPLGVTEVPPSGANRYPAFVDLVRRQLVRDYDEADLRSEGLVIVTTLDPGVQGAAETALTETLARLERERGLGEGSLEGAVVVTRVGTGDVLAVVGGRRPRYAGFNRALEARRTVGSLVKPAVLLAALESPLGYTLASPVEDAPLSLDLGGARWEPHNSDRTTHGTVLLRDAIVHSYNLAVAALGLEVGVERVRGVLRRLGLGEVPTHPSLLLGALERPPVEVAQAYQTLADGGFKTPLRAIRGVVGADGVPLRRYPLRVEATFSPENVYLVRNALEGVVLQGTARGLAGAGSGRVAGKTGTSNDFRDSWFAGFTGNWLGVVWVGRDDNGPTGLSGASGALRVWRRLYEQIGGQPLPAAPPPGIVTVWVDGATGKPSSRWRSGAVRLPFRRETRPAKPEDGGVVRRFFRWLEGRL